MSQASAVQGMSHCRVKSVISVLIHDVKFFVASAEKLEEAGRHARLQPMRDHFIFLMYGVAHTSA